MKLYMFWTAPLSVTKNFPLFTQDQDGTNSILILLASC